MKSNDNIPEDEMLLAEAIAAAMSRGLAWTAYQPFRDAKGYACGAHDATKACALGALHLAGKLSASGVASDSHRPARLKDVDLGNDAPAWWGCMHNDDRGESLGWAYRCAMEEP